MTNKKLILLGVIAVVMVALAIFQSQVSRKAHTADFSTSTLIEGLDTDAVAAIHVTSDKGAKTVKLIRKNEQFVVAEKDDYPADISKINELINKCLDVRTTDKITSDPGNHADLKVTEDTARYVITFLNADQEPIVTLLFSDADAQSNIAHARLLSSNDVYAIQEIPWFNTSAMDYVRADLLDIQRDKINSVAVKTPEDNYVLSASEDGDEIQLEKMPEGKQYKGAIYKKVFGALSGIRFDDVSSESKMPADLNFDYTYTCKLKDLTIYKLSMAKKDDKTYAKVSADFLDKTPVEKTMGQVESEEELKKKEAKLLAIDAVKKFNEEHQGWIYRIPSYKADDLTKPLSELIEDIPQPKEKSEPNVPATNEVNAAATENNPAPSVEN